MKPQPPLPSLLLSCVLGLALVATPALAQQAPPSVDPFATVAPLIAEINFDGLNLEKAVQELAHATGENIVVADEVKDMPVPAMKLRNVTSRGVLKAIANSGLQIVVSETSPLSSGESPVWVVSAALTAAPAPNQTKIFNLSSVYIESVTPADPTLAQDPEVFSNVTKQITDAVRDALATRAMATKSKKPASTVMRVHEATRLMIVSGAPEEVDIARQVICALGGKSVE